MSLNASSASSRKALLTQRCAPLLARLLLLEARAAVPWLPGPRGGRRGLAAAHPIQPPRLRGANLALWVDALRCPPLSTALRCSTRKPPLARSRTSGSLIGVPTKPGFDPKGGLRRQGLLCRGSQGFARRPRRGDELPRPRPRQRRALAGRRQKAAAIPLGTAERLRRFPPRNRNEPALRSSPSMRPVFWSVLRPLTQRKQRLWHTLCRAGG